MIGWNQVKGDCKNCPSYVSSPPLGEELLCSEASSALRIVAGDPYKYIRLKNSKNLHKYDVKNRGEALIKNL